jgi:hypothetical protein
MLLTLVVPSSRERGEDRPRQGGREHVHCASLRERLPNKRPLFMCHLCDMDAPVLGDTGWESIDFAGIWQNDPEQGILGHLGA